MQALVRQGIHFHEAIMNLPNSAVEFLDVFVGLYQLYDQLG